MRQCPECGYKDLPIWRKSWNKRFTDYCQEDELKIWDEHLYKKLKAYPIASCMEIEGYRYVISKRGYIKRIHVSDCMYPNKLSMSEPPYEHVQEKVRRGEKLPFNQKKLIPETGKA